MAAPHDIDVYIGDDFSLPITIKSNGSTLDVSGWTFKAQMATAYGTTAAATFTIASGSASSGELVLSLTSTQTAALSLRSSYVWDFERSTPGVWTLLYGKVRVRGQVTT